MADYGLTNSTATGLGLGPQTLTTTYKTIILAGVGSSNSASGSPSGGAVLAGNAKRGKIYDILVGTMSVPADTAIQWSLQRVTAIGSSASAYLGVISSFSSGVALDTADVGANGFLLANSSAETNITKANELWNVGLNQRASYRWVAAPGSEFVYPATSSAGLALCAISSVGGYSGVVTATALLAEQ